MIVILKKDISAEQLSGLKQKLQETGAAFELHENGDPILRIKTNQNLLSKDFFLSQPGVKDVFRITPAYPLAARKREDDSTVVAIGEYRWEPDHFTVIAGPCAVESEEQISGIARQLANAGVRFLRGGAFKPRTSPYAFQGLGEAGLRYLRNAADRFGMKVVTEAISSSVLPLVAEYADVIQIGTRNMQNYSLLKDVGKRTRPILLKRGMNATIEEFLLAAEYILQEGNSNVFLCERGIRTFETATRNTLDISAIPLLKQMTHLPVIVDPSHASGKRSLILPLSRAAIAAGADGLLIEVHDQAEFAKSDGPQSINFSTFDDVLNSLREIAPLLKKRVM